MRRSNNDSGGGVYEVVREFPSQSKPGKWYQVKRKLATGELSCNCPVWIFSGRSRHCDHVRAVQSGTVAGEGVPPSPRRPTTPPRAERVARPPSDAYRRVGAMSGYEIYRDDSVEPPGCYFCGCAEFQRERVCRHVEQAIRLDLGSYTPTEYRAEPRGVVDGFTISRITYGRFTSRRGAVVRTGYLCSCEVCERDGVCAHVQEFERREQLEEERAERERTEWNERAWSMIATAARTDETVKQGLDWVLRRRDPASTTLLPLSFAKVGGTWREDVTVRPGDYYCTCDSFRAYGACPHVRAQIETDAAFARAGRASAAIDSDIESDGNTSAQSDIARVPVGRCAHCGDAVFEDEVEREMDGAVFVFHRRHLGKECFRLEVQFREYGRNDGQGASAGSTIIVVRTDDQADAERWRSNRARGGIRSVDDESD